MKIIITWTKSFLPKL